MSIDAQQWVWNESRSRGNTRLVLLAVADKIQTPDCTVRMGTTELRRRLNTSKSVVVTAVDKALESGELVIVEPAVGSRAALYQLPQAVGYSRPSGTPTGPESGPVDEKQGSGSRTPKPEQGSGIRTGSENARGPESGPGGSGIETPRGPESGPHYQTSSTKHERASEEPASDSDIPDFARPLVDGCTLAGVDVRWPFNANEWLQLHSLINKTGVPRLVDYANRAYTRQHGDIDSARYFIRGWRELAPTPNADTPRPPLRAVNGGWQPYQNPADHSVYENGW